MAAKLKKLRMHLKQIRSIGSFGKENNKPSLNKYVHQKSRNQLIKLMTTVDMDEN